MATEFMTNGLLLVALLISTFMYGQLIRRRHRGDNAVHRSMDAIADNYGRSGLP